MLSVAGSCSFLIDVEPDCQDPVCIPYRCTPDGVACGVSCVNDNECAAGFSCDPIEGVCEFSGCTVFTGVERVALDLPDLVTEVDMVTVHPETQPEQMLVAVGNRNLFGYRRFQMSGSPAPDQVDPSRRLLVQVPTNPDVRRFSPSLTAFPPPSVARSDRFVFGFVDVGSTPAFPVVGEFVVNPRPVSPEANTVGPGAGRNTIIEGTSIASSAESVGVAWIEALSSENRVYLTEVLPNGIRVNDADLEPLSRPGEKPEQTELVAVSEGWVLVYVGLVGGERQIVVLAVAKDGSVRFRGQLLSSRAASYPVDSISASATDAGVVIAWQGGADADRAVQRVWLSERTLERMFASEEVELRPADVDASLSSPRRVATAASASEYVVLTSGSRSGRDGMWLYRFTDGGEPTNAPVRIAPRSFPSLDLFRVSATSLGFAVVWSERDAEQQRSTVYYSNFYCE